MLPDLLFLLERARTGLGGDLCAVMHDGLQGDESFRTQDPEHLREDLVQRVMVGQAKVGQGMMINREEACQPAKAGIVLAASLDLSRRTDAAAVLPD
jgi:hypothetical protein